MYDAVDRATTWGSVGITGVGAVLAQVASDMPNVQNASIACVAIGAIVAVARLFYSDRQSARIEKTSVTTVENQRLREEVTELRRRNETILQMARDGGLADRPQFVLLVEDNSELGAKITQMLRQAGHRVVRAASVAEAISRYDEEPPDVVVTDLSLPGGDGEILLEHVRSSGLPCRTVVISGTTDEGRIARARTLGALVLTKPVVWESFRDAIRPAATGEHPLIRG